MERKDHQIGEDTCLFCSLGSSGVLANMTSDIGDAGPELVGIRVFDETSPVVVPLVVQHKPLNKPDMFWWVPNMK